MIIMKNQNYKEIQCNSQTLETYKEMLNNSNVSEEQKAIITQEITNVNKEKKHNGL